MAARDYEKVVFCDLYPPKEVQSSQSSKAEEKLRKRFGRKTKENCAFSWYGNYAAAL